jgi:predicted peptidase
VTKEDAMAQSAERLDRQIIKTVKLDYLLHLPRSLAADPLQRWPLVLFLHGAGERGSDLNLVKRHGIAKVAESDEVFPFIAASPQCPADSLWDEHVDALLALLEEVSASYPVDADRVYLTGLSLGGYGAWNLAVLHPDRFAALAPVCGGAIPMRGFPGRVSALRRVPVWAFHGALDPVVPVRESESLVEALRACGGEARLTVYPDAAHDSWTRTYENPELYRWFLSHRRDASD